jgi:transcriptional regulator with XRE-family HTH domain
MIIGDRLRALREEKKLSQGDIEKRTGLLRCYVSRVENGHTVPSIETLEKWARALNIPMYQLFYEGEEPPSLPDISKKTGDNMIAWGSFGKQVFKLRKLQRALSLMDNRRRKLLMAFALRIGSGRHTPLLKVKN